jgi:hypothetical protein
MNACSRNGDSGHTGRGITQVNRPAYGSVGMFEPFTPAGKNLASPPQWERMARSLKQTDIETCEASLVDEGSIITGGGVSLRIDTTLHLLEKLFGPGVAAETARIIEYQRAWAANLDQFRPCLTGANR